MMDPTNAHARHTAPDTSHEAAASVAPKLRASQSAVLSCLREFGPMHDEHLVQAYQRWAKTAGWPMQSASGIRSRRKELMGAGMVVVEGSAKTESGRRAYLHRALENVG